MRLWILWVLVISGCKASLQKKQNPAVFEGVLSYLMHEHSGSLELINCALPGDTIRVHIKDENYRISCNKGETILFQGGTNLIYHLYPISDITICSVMNAADDKQFSESGIGPEVEVSDSMFVISGKQCRKVKISWRHEFIEYYFQSAYLQVNPEMFQNHFAHGWSVYLKQAKCLPVKVIYSKSGSLLSFDLVKVQHEPVPPSLFRIPELVPLDELQAPGGRTNLLKVKP